MQQKLFNKVDNLETTDVESEEELIELLVEEIKTDMKLNECIEKLNDITVLLKEIAQVMGKPVEAAKAPIVSNILDESEGKPCLSNFKFTNPPTAEDFVTIKKIAIEEYLHTSEVSTFLSSCEESLILKEFFSNIPDFKKLLQGEFDWEVYDAVQVEISGTGEYFALKERAQREFKQRRRPTDFLSEMISEINSRAGKRTFINWSSVLCFFLDILPDSNRVFSSLCRCPLNPGFLEKLHLYQQPTRNEYHVFWEEFSCAYLRYLRGNPTHCRYEILFSSYEPNSDESYYMRVRRVVWDGIESPPPVQDTRKSLYDFN